MNTKQIDCILELAKTRNFSKAAENIHIAQPTLTYQIKSAEDELGFPLFDRTIKGAVLTPAGSQFCTVLRNIREELKRAKEQAQNFSQHYHMDVSIGLPMRSALHFLPQAIKQFEQDHPLISVTPHFLPLADSSSFLKGEEDILFAMEHDVKHLPDTILHSLFISKIYLMCQHNDPLAQKDTISTCDLAGRVLMVGGGSPPQLCRVQQRIIQTLNISYFNSASPETTQTYLAADKGLCLAPGFLNDHRGEFAWIPFNCPETIPCVLCTHKREKRSEVLDLVKLLQQIYASQSDFIV
ncbi:MAG: LysR family transcriptional regulator [bacterium]|nr:LysR family transcriptional regulator [bacterium]